jgi:hypothetical protein
VIEYAGNVAPSCESPITGIWEGSPIAVRPCAFTLLDDENRTLSFVKLIQNPRCATHLHARIWFDKSSQNFTICKIRRAVPISHPHLLFHRIPVIILTITDTAPSATKRLISSSGDRYTSPSTSRIETMRKPRDLP